MGYDTDSLRIIGMNATGRKGRMYNDFRRANLRNLIENERPDILFLPGDNLDPDTFTQTSYQQLMDSTHNQTVLLYDSTRLRIKEQTIDPQFRIPNNELANVLAPMVDITSPAPAQSIVKQFICVSWHQQFTVIERGSQVLYEIGRLVMMYAQFLAWFTGNEVFIGGDFNIPYDAVCRLIKEHNSKIEEGIDSIKPEFQKLGYMDCMTETIHRPQRRLRQLKIHSCKSVEKIGDPDFFVASKEMQLRETKKVQWESASRIQTRPSIDYCPEPTYTKTEMYIPPRPPKNHGG